MFLALVISSAAIANDENMSSKQWKPYKSFALGEGLFVLNSYIASLSPEGAGTLLTLVSPLAGMSETESSAATRWVSFGSAAGIGLYNALELGEDKYSQSDVFKRNLIAWNLTGAAIYLTEKYTGKKQPSINISASGNSVLFTFHKLF